MIEAMPSVSPGTNHDPDHKIEQIRRIAMALATDVPVDQMAQLVARECGAALLADAICVYWTVSRNCFQMLSECGCTEEFKTTWRIVPKGILPMHDPANGEDGVFIGTAEEFKRLVPDACAQVDRSGRKVIGYAPFFVNAEVLGLIAFSYNEKPARAIDRDFVLTLVNISGQAIHRILTSENEKRLLVEAEAANRAKSEFLASVSHEIRTPLGLICGFTDLLAEEPGLSSQALDWIRTVSKHANQLTRIIGDVLDLSKIEADRVEVEQTHFNPCDLIEEVCAFVRPESERKGLELRVLGARELPPSLCSDPTRVRQILINLIGNSIKFTSQGSITIKTTCSEEGLWTVRLEDTGIGIHPDYQAKIFQPFTQADTSTHRQFGGTGLGLAISSRLASALGGELVLIRSQPGEGSVFQFSMKCAAKVAGAIPEKKPERSEPALAGCRLLLVDDSPDNREMIQIILKREGAEVDFADSGITGIHKALNGHYDLVLMDIQMPGMDGWEAVSILRSRGYDRPIAALTAHALSFERENSHKRGVNAYLTKPIDRREMVRTIRELSAGHPSL